MPNGLPGWRWGRPTVPDRPIRRGGSPTRHCATASGTESRSVTGRHRLFGSNGSVLLFGCGRLLVPNDKAELGEDPHRAGLATLEVARGQAGTRGEFICRAENRLGRVAPFVLDQLVGGRRREPMRLEESVRAQPVVLGQGLLDVGGVDMTPVG